MTDIEAEEGVPSTPPLQELGRQLEAERVRPRHRLPKGYKKSDVPRDICSEKTLSRLESGRYRGVKVGTVLNLLRFYQTPHAQVDHIARLAEASRARDWCSVYGGVIEDQGWFLQQCEDAASYLCYHSALVLPSLIHSEAYCRMIQRTTKASYIDDLDWEEVLEYRMERRQRWIDSERSALFLIGEEALSARLGDDREAILADLKQIAALPFADVRVIPIRSGRYDLQTWSLNLFEYDNGQETVIHVESMRGGGFVPADSSRGKFLASALKEASRISITPEGYFQ